VRLWERQAESTPRAFTDVKAAMQSGGD